MSWLLVLALLLNLLFLYVIFFIAFDLHDFFSPKNEIFEHDAPVVFESPQQEEPQEQPPPINEVAALKPRASQFGATELVQDEPEFTPGVYDKLIPEVLGKDESDNEKTEEISTEQTKDFDTKSKSKKNPPKKLFLKILKVYSNQS